MIPGVYPFFALPGDVSTQGVQAQTTDGSGPSYPASLVQQALLQEALRGVGLNPVVSLFCNPNIGCPVPLNLLPGGVQFSSLNSSYPINPLIFYPTPGQVSFPIGATSEAVRGEPDAHTIVRAPVLYKTATNGVGADQRRSEDGSKSTEQSPPDRIVASYAAAAHAAALVNHQPVSKAAENFLSASSIPRTRHAKRSRAHATNGLGRFNSSETSVPPRSDVQLSLPSSSLTSSAVSTTTERRAGWARIVDQKAGTVEYITPNGVRLHNRTEVFDYFRTTYPSFADGKQYEELTAMCFNFEPTADVPLISDELHRLSNPSLSHIGFSNTVTSPTADGSAPDTPASKDSSSTICRISFNPNHTLNDNLSPMKRAKLSAPDSSIGSPQSSSAIDPPLGSSETVNQVTSQAGCMREHAEFDNPTTCSGNSNDTSVPCVVTTHPNVLDSSQSHVEPQTNDVTRTAFAPGDVTSSSTVTSNEVPNEESVAKMTTETLTTGSTASYGLPVIPSVVPPSDARSAMESDVGLSSLSGLKSDAATALQLTGGIPSNAANELAILNQLIANSRLAEVQLQQQQVAALLTALSSQSAHHNLCTTLPSIPLLSGPQHTTPLLLASQPLWMTPAVTANSSWSEVASATSPISPVTLQQQMIAAAAAQQQQLALAALLQRQQSANQQHFLNSAAQVQNYLNAFQRHLFDGSHQ
ncbi:unnamed protein product [Dicrocoelium dendriticum]|nr:unnamed protein product [Dicrocoelium dendriticum]